MSITGALVANYPFDGPNSGVYSAAPDDDLFVHISLAYANAHPNMESGGFSCFRMGAGGRGWV